MNDEYEDLNSFIPGNIKPLNKGNNYKKASGLFDLRSIKYCSHPEHQPPKYLHIPQGKGYRHVCLQCGCVTIIIPPQISF